MVVGILTLRSALWPFTRLLKASVRQEKMVFDHFGCKSCLGDECFEAPSQNTTMLLATPFAMMQPQGEGRAR
jgi:hypothetical protein